MGDFQFQAWENPSQECYIPPRLNFPSNLHESSKQWVCLQQRVAWNCCSHRKPLLGLCRWGWWVGAFSQHWLYRTQLLRRRWVLLFGKELGGPFICFICLFTHPFCAMENLPSMFFQIFKGRLGVIAVPVILALRSVPGQPGLHSKTQSLNSKRS